MRLSRSLVPTLKETPAEAQIVSHRLMLRAGLVRQTAAGIYAWLPAGWRVLQKIAQIVREEQDAIGAQEMLMPTIQSANLWRTSGRFDAYGPEMLRLKDRHERDMLYGPTNEEMITDIFRHSVKSYRELPQMLYHIQWKFRDEVRPRFGVMRGREFLMKDAYSFDMDYAGAVLLFADDSADLVQDPDAERQPGVAARGLLPDHAGAQHEAMRDDLRLFRRLLQDRQEITGKTHGARLLTNESARPYRPKDRQGQARDHCLRCRDSRAFSAGRQAGR